MLKLNQCLHFCALILVLAGLGFAPFTLASDTDDILAVVQQYGDLEGDLKEQAKLIRDDRVMVTNIRQTDAAKNMAIQLADRKANDAVNGGPAKWVTTIESPQVAVYGDTAVTSFMRMFSIYPPNKEPIHTPATWVTLVLVKEKGNWGIAHTHVSSTSDD